MRSSIMLVSTYFLFHFLTIVSSHMVILPEYLGNNPVVPKERGDKFVHIFMFFLVTSLLKLVQWCASYFLCLCHYCIYNCSYLLQQRENFKSSSNSLGVQSQLSTLAQIVKIVDPKLHRHLGKSFLFFVYSSVAISMKEVKNARSCHC